MIPSCLFSLTDFILLDLWGDRGCGRNAATWGAADATDLSQGEDWNPRIDAELSCKELNTYIWLLWLYMYLHIYIYIYVCMYVYIYIYIYMHSVAPKFARETWWRYLSSGFALAMLAGSATALFPTSQWGTASFCPARLCYTAVGLGCPAVSRFSW